VRLSELDQQVFVAVVPADHYLRQVKEQIDFERFRSYLVEAYSATMGRPAIDPVRMLKIAFLRFHYRLSDRQVMERTKTDMAFRWFLDLGLHEAVPDHTNGTHFRQRIGSERFVQVFQELMTQARERGLVRDRLRLKDATHLFADAADVPPLVLAAKVSERLLQAATPFFADWVSEQRTQLQRLQQTTAEFRDDERLAQRVEQLRRMANELQERAAALPTATAADSKRQRLDRALALVAKLVDDQADPEAGDRLASVADPEARCGKHGEFFVGYLLDLAIDADSELITAVNVLPGNAAEASDAAELIRQEETAQGNDVAELSMDGAGYNGPVLRELTDPAGLNLEVTVPPPPAPPRTTFGPERFTLTLVDDRPALTCPNGQTTTQRDRSKHGWKYIFKKDQCGGCPLRAQCLEKPEVHQRRKVIKNDYEAEYQRLVAKAATPEYQQTRHEHPKIERKLGEVVRYHGGRRACYRGRAKVFCQALLTALVVNIKRLVKLLTAATAAAPTVAVRAALPAT
jgi:transposase